MHGLEQVAYCEETSMQFKFKGVRTVIAYNSVALVGTLKLRTIDSCTCSLY